MKRVLSKMKTLPLWKSAAAIAGIEALALLLSRNNIYREGLLPALATVLFLIWFWFSVFCAALVVTQIIGTLENRRAWPGRIFRWAVAAGVIAFGVQYAVSWALYLQTGQFATLAAFEFAVRNPPQTTWLYLGPGERRAVVITAILVVIALPLTAWALRQIGRAHVDAPISQRPSHRTKWIPLTICVALCFRWIHQDASDTRRHMRTSALRACVNPQFTLTATLIDRLLGEPISATLKNSELVAINDWQPPPKTGQQPSVIFIAVEAMRWDVVHLKHQGREITPNLNRLADGGIEWTRAYTQSTHSDYADVCIVSSLYPLRTREHHYYQRHDPWPRTLAFDAFKKAGYATAIISSQNESWGGMDRFLETPSLDLFYDAERSGEESYLPRKDIGFWKEKELGAFSAGCLYDWRTMDTAIAWTTEQFESNRPFFLSMNFQSSHFPYELPEGTARPFQPAEITDEISFACYPPEKAMTVRNAYYNGLHYCDQQLGRMIKSLEAAGRLDDVILVVMGENGEAFHENGSVGHAQNPVEPAIHVATVLHAPKFVQPAKDDYPMELVDVLPTVFGILDWTAHPNFQGIDVLSADRTAAKDRLLFFHVNSPLAQSDAVLLAGRWKYSIDFRTHSSTLHDIERDPGESTDISATHPALAAALGTVLRQWRNRQLAYYHYPAYYQSFFPPKPPAWQGIPAVRSESGPVVMNPPKEMASPR